jgi:Zinc carboxypeptidase
MRTVPRLLFIATLLSLLGPVGVAAIRVDANIPGGNIVLDSIEGGTIRVHQDLRDTEGEWFYWAFRVRGAEGRTLNIEFTQGNVIGVRGPAVSADHGRHWQWLGAEAMEGTRFRYHVPYNVAEVRFSVTIPYFESDLRAFLRRHRGYPALESGVLARSKKGRAIEQLRLGCLNGEPQSRVLLTARHHACESLASYSLEGILESILSLTEDGRWFRENVEFLVVPFMDKDGVEDGDQGKNRLPHDHNRDYMGESIYPSVRALRGFVPRWSGGRLKIALDMHCPYIRGKDESEDHEDILFVGGPNWEIWSRIEQFSRVLESVQTGPLVYSHNNNLPFGKAWNTAKPGDLKSFAVWASEQPGILFASTIEIPYANAGGNEVNAESARSLGRDLARALRIYLQENTISKQ